MIKKQSFVTGAAILMMANIISKILGAVFKIPLTYILKEEGMAIYNSAFQIYILFLSFVISGLPFAISKLVSEYSAKKEKAMVCAVINVSTKLLFIIGITLSLILYFGADFFALALKEDRAAFAIKMIAPSVFFVAIGCIYKNYFQGISNMIPSAISQVIEAIIKLLAGFYLAFYFIDFGTYKASGGAALGISIGEAIATLILFLLYILLQKERTRSTPIQRRTVLSQIGSIAIPLLFASVISSMLSVMDTTIMRASLLDYGHNIDEARFIYGAYTGYALTLFHLPVGILATLGVSILPLVAGSIAVNDMKRAQKVSSAAIRLSIILSLPCAVAIYFMGENMLDILFNNTYSAKMLKLISPCVLFLCVSQISNAIIQSAGKILQSFLCALISSVIKLILYYLLIPKMSIYGAIIGADISYFIYMILSLVLANRTIGVKYSIKDMMIKPAISIAMMIVVLILVQKPLEYEISNVYILTALKCIFCGSAYVLTLVLTGGVSIKEIRRLLK